jgi:hypothetical protein
VSDTGGDADDLTAEEINELIELGVLELVEES